MAARPVDRELRRHILKLRSFAAEDFDAIIDSLDDIQRGNVLDMLAEFDGVAETGMSEEPKLPMEPVILPAELSPWLVARVNGQGDSGEETADPFTISPHAQKALRRCAAAMVPQPPPKKASPSLVERVWQGFSR